MCPIDTIFVMGLDHRHADLEMRSKLSLNPSQRVAARELLSRDLGLDAQVLLSTCNRTELYGHWGAPDSAPGDRDLATRLFPNLDDDTRPNHLFGWDCVFHLFRVSASLDSMIIGESEIQRQVKHAFEESQQYGSADRVLQELFRQALEVGKRVRNETKLGEGQLSIASTSLKLAQKVVGSLSNKNVLVIGAGETGALVFRHLLNAEVESICVLNRNAARAEELVSGTGARSGSLAELGPELDAADLVISCVEASEPILTATLLKGSSSKTRCVIDISVPASVDPAIADIAGVFAFNLDDVGVLIDQVRDERSAEIQAADEIIVAESHKFLSLQTYAGMADLVAELQGAFELERQDAQMLLRRGSAAIPEAETQALHAEIDARLEAMTKRLLGRSLETLKKSARQHISLEQVSAAYELFLNKE